VRRLRRTATVPHIDLTAMLDMVFNLLLFFIYATMVMVRVDILPMQLASFQRSKGATPAPAITVSVGLDGKLALERVPIEIGQLRPKLEEAKAKDPKTVVYIALADGEGSTDRAPLLQELWDRLGDVGLPINFVGRPSLSSRTAPGP
jgi:biopolymer transport protein ExbD